ncbi:MAG: PAS domain-containing protein [Lentisphaeria bacterium]|nr:PAS domain-containing protein [Lentisphaeria bacterium]
MKSLHRNPRTRWLTLLYGFALGALLAALAVLCFDHSGPLALRSGVGMLLVPAFLALLFVGLRLLRFRTRTHTLLRRLLAGDYQSGIRPTRHLQDDISELEALQNRLVQQLREYDDLRTGRIRQLRMTLGLLAEHTIEPLILFDAQKGVLDFNPAMSAILGVARQSVPLETLRNLETNTPFDTLLTRATLEEKSNQTGQVTIQLPGQATPKTLDLRIIVYKDKMDNIAFALLFVKPISDSDT